MANWTHTYREQAIPGPNPSGTITEHRPGQKLAKAVTELQERVVVDVETDLEGIEDQGTVVENNTLTIRLKAEGATQTLFAVAGGEWPQLTVQEVEVENGLIKSVTDGQELYPDFELANGNVVVGQSASFNSQTRVLTITQTLREVNQGIVTPTETTASFEVSIPGGEPEGLTGIVKQVVDMKFEDNKLKVIKRNFDYSNGLLQSISLEEEETVIEFEPFQCPS